MYNDYNRVLLFSGEDEFDFFDDRQKQCSQICQLLQIENKTDIDINEVAVSTKTSLRNMNTDALLTYNTNNCTSLLRGHESIFYKSNRPNSI